MKETKPTPVVPNPLASEDKCGETITVSCDELVEFIDDASQPANAWPWPEPPFVRDPKPAEPKS